MAANGGVAGSGGFSVALSTVAPVAGFTWPINNLCNLPSINLEASGYVYPTKLNGATSNIPPTVIRTYQSDCSKLQMLQTRNKHNVFPLASSVEPSGPSSGLNSTAQSGFLDHSTPPPSDQLFHEDDRIASLGVQGTLEILKVIRILEGAAIPCCVVGVSALIFYGADIERPVCIHAALFCIHRGVFFFHQKKKKKS
jgi:hypothetical protein